MFRKLVVPVVVTGALVLTPSVVLGAKKPIYRVSMSVGHVKEVGSKIPVSGKVTGPDAARS